MKCVPHDVPEHSLYLQGYARPLTVIESNSAQEAAKELFIKAVWLRISMAQHYGNNAEKATQINYFLFFFLKPLFKPQTQDNFHHYVKDNKAS